MKLLIHLTFCFGFVVCIPWDQVILRIKDESGPVLMPNSYRSGPDVSEEVTEMPEEALVNKMPGSFRNFLGSQYPEYPEYPEYPGYPDEYRGN